VAGKGLPSISGDVQHYYFGENEGYALSPMFWTDEPIIVGRVSERANGLACLAALLRSWLCELQFMCFGVNTG
jgi:hypothetical protein